MVGDTTRLEIRSLSHFKSLLIHLENQEIFMGPLGPIHLVRKQDRSPFDGIGF